MSVNDGLDILSVNDTPSVEDSPDFLSASERQALNYRQEISFDPIDADHCDSALCLQEDNPSRENEQQVYVLPVDISKASQITGLPTLIFRLTFCCHPIM